MMNGIYSETEDHADLAQQLTCETQFFDTVTGLFIAETALLLCVVMKTYIIKRPCETVRRIFDLWADDLVRGSLQSGVDCENAINLFRAIARFPAKNILFPEANLAWLRTHFIEQLQLHGPFELELHKEVLPVLAWLDTVKQIH